MPELTTYPPVYPAGKNETYQKIDASKPLNVYTGKVTIYLPFQVKDNASPGPLKMIGSIHLQACDNDQCYQPADFPFTIETAIAARGQTVQPRNSDLFAKFDPKQLTAAATAQASSAAIPAHPILLASLYSSADLKKAINQVVHHAQGSGLQGSDWSFSYAFGAAFLAGLLFNIMPCVLPVLPIKAMGFYEVGQHQRSKSFMLGVIFSLGIIAVFAVLAMLVLVLGTITWGSLFSKPWFIWPMVVVLVVMSFGLFGAFTFSLPVGATDSSHDTTPTAATSYSEH